MSGAIGPYVTVNFTTVSNPEIDAERNDDLDWVHIRANDSHTVVYLVATDAVKDQLREIVRVWDWAEECAAHDEGCGFVGAARTKCSEPANHTGQHILVKAS